MRLVRRLVAAAVLFALAVATPIAWEAIRVAGILSTDERADLEARRRYLVGRLGAPTYADDPIAAPDDGLFEGEWRLGALSMTAAAIANLAFDDPASAPRARAEIALLIERALEPELRRFDRDRWGGEDALDSLDGPNGHAGYLGHLAFMIGAYRMIGGDARFEGTHRAVVGALARRIDESRFPYLETYPSEIYTCDNAVVLAAIALRDRVRVDGEPSRRLTVLRWELYTAMHLIDPETDLIVFEVDPVTGRARQHGRGSASGWNAFYLPFVDPALASQQRRALRRHLEVDLPFGASAVREHPHGRGDLAGDVDSGPLVFGLSPSGTGFAMAAARHDGDQEWLEALLITAEVAGNTAQSADGRERWYVLSPLVGDAIVLAMRTARPWDDRFLVQSGHAHASLARGAGGGSRL